MAIAYTRPHTVEIRRRLVHWSLRVLPVLVTVALLGLLLRSCSWEKAVDMWLHFDAGYLAASVLLMTASVAGGAIALLILFELKGRLAWWGRFTVDYFYVQALCQLTPAQAGEVVLPYVSGRGRFAPGEIAASLVIQRMVSLGIIVLVAVIGAGRWAERSFLWSAAALVLLSCLAAIAIIRNYTARSWLSELVNRRFGPVLYGFYDTWTSVLRDRRGRLLSHIILMMGRFALTVASSYAVLMAFGVAAPFWELAALSALATLAVLVPISINGIGVTEGIFVAGLADDGYGTEPVLAACLAGRVMVIFTFLAWSGAYWFLRWREREAASRSHSK
jgi:uncharacterized protein (TIRG00374 family)